MPKRPSGGWARDHSHDLLARIDLDTYTPLPWELGGARCAADIYVDGEPISPACGHNNGPSWEECVVLASEHQDLRFAGFLMPSARADEGTDLDAVYIPEPDEHDARYLQAITRSDCTRLGPDEDGIVMIDGRAYRRLWYD